MSLVVSRYSIKDNVLTPDANGTLELHEQHGGKYIILDTTTKAEYSVETTPDKTAGTFSINEQKISVDIAAHYLFSQQEGKAWELSPVGNHSLAAAVDQYQPAIFLPSHESDKRLMDKYTGTDPERKKIHDAALAAQVRLGGEIKPGTNKIQGATVVDAPPSKQGLYMAAMCLARGANYGEDRTPASLRVELRSADCTTSPELAVLWALSVLNDGLKRTKDASGKSVETIRDEMGIITDDGNKPKELPRRKTHLKLEERIKQWHEADRDLFIKSLGDSKEAQALASEIDTWLEQQQAKGASKTLADITIEKEPSRIVALGGVKGAVQQWEKAHASNEPASPTSGANKKVVGFHI